MDPEVLLLIREAVAKDVPVLGHCLGGQLMAKALGGQVTRAPVKEIGWGRSRCEPASGGRLVRGGPGAFGVFQWHGETFSLPPVRRICCPAAGAPIRHSFWDRTWASVPHRNERGAGAQLV
jgi:GMP synthase-like glutamine amidotransferase